MVKELLQLIDSFNLTHSVLHSTHKQCHRLDLCLSLGVPVSNMDIDDFCLSDHKPVTFSSSFSNCLINSKPLGKRVLSVNPSTGSKFSEAYKSSPLINTISSPPFNLGINDMVLIFNSTCKAVMDNVTPFRNVIPKSRPQPWLNDCTRGLRQTWRKAERKWKKDRLQVSYDMLKERMIKYQQSGKIAKTSYFSDIIQMNSSKPQVLFSTINTLLNPVISTFPDISSEACECFSEFFLIIKLLLLELAPFAHLKSI